MRTEADSRRSEHMAALRSALWHMPKATRAQLAKETGLSVMTVGKLLAVMEARGEVIQSGTLRGAASGDAFVTIDMRGVKIHIVCVGVALQRCQLRVRGELGLILCGDADVSGCNGLWGVGHRGPPFLAWELDTGG